MIWARRHRNWGEIDWACVDYGDEATFEIGLVPRTHVWRPKGKAYESKYLQPTFKSGRSSIGVWGAISWNGKSKLVIMDENQRMNSKFYITLILGEAGFDI